jgi:hypothetical protein
VVIAAEFRSNGGHVKRFHVCPSGISEKQGDVLFFSGVAVICNNPMIDPKPPHQDPTNGKKLMLQRQLPFALSLSKGVFRVLQEAQLTENMDPR